MKDDDEYIELIERAMRMSVGTGAFAMTILDILPLSMLSFIRNEVTTIDFDTKARYIPAWFPGMGIKKRALSTQQFVDKVLQFPYSEIKTKRASLHDFIGFT